MNYYKKGQKQSRLKKAISTLFVVAGAFGGHGSAWGFALPVDQNFDSETPSLRGLTYTLGDITYEQISPVSQSQMATLSESSTFIITPNNGDLGLLYNIDNAGSISGPNVGSVDYRFKTADGSEFKLESMEADMSANNSANGYRFTLTITGYRDGSSVVSDTIDFTASDSAGSVTYAQMAPGNGGTLTFNSDWSNIDEVRFTGGNSSEIRLLMIDSLDFSAPVPSNNAPTILGTPTDITVIEDTSSNVDLSAVTLADSDGDSLTVTLTASAGTFSTPADGSALSVTETLVNATTVTLAGTAANINTYLDTASNLKYTGAANVTGNDAATLTISVSDGVDSLASNPVVNVDITSVNDQPTLAIGSNQSVGSGTGNVQQSVNSFASMSDDGDTESVQAIADFIVSEASDTASVVSGVDIDNSGTLVFTPANGVEGIATIDVQVQDDGGTANSGVDTSSTSQFTITVDTKAPVISSVSIPDSAHKVGDAVTVTINAGETGLSLVSGSVNGVNVTGFTDNNNNTYSATYTIVNGGTDLASNVDVPVSFALQDAAGNVSAPFTTAISQANDAIYANLPVISLSTADGTLGEDGDTEALTVAISGTLNNLWPADIFVNLAYSGTATNAVDYTRPASITISANNTSGTANLTGIADDIFDAASAETIVVDINTVSVGSENGAQQETVNITDAESAPTVALSVSNATIAENGGTSNITATLNHATYEAVTVNLSYAGTATSGSDYNNTVSSSITISGGSTSGNVATGITGIDDATEEGDETIIIDIASVSGGSASEDAIQQQTITMQDDDDTTAPLIASVSVPANGTYATSSALSFTVNTNETVTVNTTGGTPRLVLDIGGVTKYANYASGSPGTALVFSYSVESGLADADGIALTSIEMNSGTIRDGANNDLDLTLNSVGTLSGVLVESVMPIVTHVTATTADGSYKAGDVLSINVVFDDTVIVNTTSGTPYIELETGTTDRQVAYASGSGSNTLVFDYTVQAGDTSADLDYVNTTALSTAGGTIQDNNGNSAVLTLATPGAANSLGANKALVIDTSAPVAPVVTSPTVDQSTQQATLAVDGTHAENGVTVVLLTDANDDGTADNSTAIVSATVTAGNWSLNAPLNVGVNNFVIQARDAAGNTSSDVNVVSLTRTSPPPPPPPTNTAPVISGTPQASVTEDSEYSFTPNASDVDNDPLTFSISGMPTWASFDSTTGQLVGTPVREDLGTTENITISVSDGTVSSSLPAFSIEVVKTSNIPVITTANMTLAEDSSNTIAITVSQNKYATLTISQQPIQGTAELTGNNLSYTPNENFNGTDSLVLVAADGELISEPATVSITVTPVNDAPIANDDSFELVSVSDNFTAFDVLANDTDVDNDTLSLFQVKPELGEANIQNNQLNFRAPQGFDGVVNISYVIRDAKGAQASANAAIAVSTADNNLTIAAPEDITVNAKGLFTKVDMGTAVAKDGAGNDLPVSADSRGFFSPGIHKVVWSAELENEKISATQTVNVVPLVSLSKNQTSTEGSQVNFKVILNGNPVNYPVTVPFTVAGTAAIDGSDHDLIDNEVTFEKNELEKSVTFNLVDDGTGEGNETVIVTLGEPTNAVLGNKTSHTLTIAEDNIAPSVTLTASQNGMQTRIINQSEGLVTITAHVTDPNVADFHSYDWSKSDNAILTSGNDESSFTIDPAALTPGFYKVRIEVSDGDKQGKDRLKLRIEESLPVLNETDSDGDGINDNDEGHGDTDGDGIPDFLDSINLRPNVVQERKTQDTAFLMETEPGLVLTLGEVAFRSSTSQTEVTFDDVNTHGNNGTGAESDNTHQYSNGLFDFNVEELPVAGQSVTIVVAQFAPIPASAVYRKLMASGWQNFVLDENNMVASAPGAEGFCPPPGDAAYISGLTEGHWCVQLTIQDGGPNDADGEVNQAIDDPGGVAVEKTGNQVPVANDDEAETLRTGALYIDVLANDTDADDDELTITSASADIGEVTIEDDQLYYVALQGHFGQAHITYGISDGKGGSASAEVVVNVLPNRVPVTTNDSAETDNQTSIKIDVLANDTDADGDALTVISASAEHGEVTINSDSTLNYKPASSFEGTDTLVYTVSDSFGGTAQGTVAIKVKANETKIVKSKGSSGGSFSLFTLVVLLLASLRCLTLFNSRKLNSNKTKW
ncbi:Ig-like domain-containing protein [Thalassotalea marina]|uniref:GlyGly-CTERM sorting domain-containing protein n=1 Tax=Thalassotalea marina TaxID=1673741 RepID=A0A919BEG8_9GAMM|nr:Ig-like domain-containing protein [Thalassotalea marina]GHF83308.1 GlyGly-CTERM sorting domain-containing protein [Thalassotalea marina]